MSDRPPSPSGERLFLERSGYRLRRLADAGRMLPLLGGVLIVLPLLWSPDGETSGTLLYLFAVWGGLILCAAALSRGLGRPMSEDPGESGPPGGDAAAPGSARRGPD